MLEALIVLYCIAMIAISWLLIKKYRSVRDIGLLWLGAGLVLFPLISGLARAGERTLIDRLAAGESVGFYPFSLVEQGKLPIGKLYMILFLSHHLVEAILILIGVALLYRNRSIKSLASGNTAMPYV